VAEKKTRAVIVDSAGGTDLELIRRELAARSVDDVIPVSGFDEATRELRNGGPAIAFVPVGDDDSEGVLRDGTGIGLIEALRNIRPELPVVATGSAPIPALILRAAQAGADEFLVRPLEPGELGAALDRLLEESGLAARRGRAVAVYSAKGGLGNTTLAVNLAFAATRRSSENQAALVDLVAGSGDIRTFLNITPRYTIKDIAKKSEEIDRPSLKALLHTYPGRVWVCTDPSSPDEGELLTGPRVTSIVRSLMPSFAFTIIDCEHSLTERTLAALDLADTIVLPIQLTVPAVRSLQRTLGLFGRLGYRQDKLALVVNRLGCKADLTLSDLEKVIRLPVVGRIPNDFLATNGAVTKGEPIHQVAPKSKVLGALDELIVRLEGPMANGAGDTASRSRLPGLKLFGRKRG
jgi:pilus assembly protein CpaE